MWPQRSWFRSAGVLVAVAVVVLTGCGNFFVPPNNGGGGGGGGGGTGGTGSIYIANQSAGSLSGFTIGNGTVTQISGLPMSLGFQPTALVVSPNNSFLYVAGTGSISVYAINSDGSLTAKNNGVVISVLALDVSPDGKWLFGLDAIQNTLDEFQIDASSGGLSAMTPIPYPLGNGVTASPRMVKVSSGGNFIFAALGTGGDSVFTLNTATGDVVHVQHLSVNASSTSDNALTVDSATSYLYIARSGSGGGVGVYSIGSGGVLNPISGSPFAAGAQPFAVTLDTTGKYLYVANRQDSTISGYSVGTAGSLTALANSPFTSGTQVNSLGTEKSGTYVFAGASGGGPDLSMYSLDTTALGKLNLTKSVTTDSATTPAGVVAITLTH